jgi:hypothetical protein
LETLFDKLDRGLGGIRLYGIAPPKLATDPARLAEIASQQVARLRELAPDGLIIYDIQDEPGRDGQERPFPFLPTIDAEQYAEVGLAALALPKIVYRSVGADSRESFVAWLDGIRTKGERNLRVFVGAPRGRSVQGLPLNEAYELAKNCPELVWGGIAIAERHVTKGDEHLRMLSKQDAGCRFFVTQSVYNADSTRSLLSDYALAMRTRAAPAVPVILTFSPCGSARTLEFMKWLGISFPRWLENELRHSADPLERSIDLCEAVFLNVQEYAREKAIPLGINVESVSIRKAEVDASIELFRRLSGRLLQLR